MICDLMIILGPVAVADNLVIGKGNDLPWYLPEDLKHFKKITLGKTVVMGRKTYESIVKRLNKPLPGRKNVVISRQTDYKVPEGVLVFNSLTSAVTALLSEDLYIIGGAEIYKQALPLAQKLYMTHVSGNFEGDAYFPEVDFSQWEKVEEQPHEGYTFAVYSRKP
jgi:dihydrofolate reductase